MSDSCNIMRIYLANVGLLIISIIFCIGMLELGLRLTGIVQVGPHPPLIFQESSNPAISYELKSSIVRKAYRSTVKTNTLGLRSEERDPSRPLFVTLGDSITFGYGVENDETIAAQLERQIPDIQFLNAGVPGYHLGQETALYREKIAALDPAGVIVVFHPNDMHAGTGWIDADGVLRAEGDDPKDRPALRCDPIATGILSKIPWSCWLDRKSALYVGIKKFIRMRTSMEALKADQAESAQHPEVDDITDADVAAYTKQLQVFRALLSVKHQKIFVLWPDRNLHAVSRPKIAAAARQQGFTVVDLYDTFGNTAKTLSWDSVHPHPETIARAAEITARAIHQP
jgi:lysophospholipase L1-like esterase